MVSDTKTNTKFTTKSKHYFMLLLSSNASTNYIICVIEKPRKYK